MKRLAQFLFIYTMLALVSTPGRADEQHTINLDGPDASTVLEFPDYTVIVQVDANASQPAVTVEVENSAEGVPFLMIYHGSYTEKQLKKNCNPSATYDKNFGGTKGKRDIKPCPELLNPVFQICRGQRSKVAHILLNEGESHTMTLPIYQARPKGKTADKLILQSLNVIELELNLISLQDNEYVYLRQTCDSLFTEIGNNVLCTNANHKGTSYKVLEADYSTSIENLKQRIKESITERKEKKRTNIEELQEMLNTLDNIDLKSMEVSHCKFDKGGGGGHSCKYDKLSYQEIYERLEDIYQQIHNGKITVKQVKSDVEMLNTCAKMQKRKTGANFKKGIERYYNKINEM